MCVQVGECFCVGVCVKQMCSPSWRDESGYHSSVVTLVEISQTFLFFFANDENATQVE